MAVAPSLGSFASLSALTTAFSAAASPVGASAFTTDQNLSWLNTGVDWIQVATNSFFNVLAFGADPTGTNDNATAFAAAVTAVGSTGGVIYIPRGTYNIGTALSIANDAITFIGEGKRIGASGITNAGATFINCTGTNDFIAVSGSASSNQLSVRNMFIGSANAGSGSAFNFNTTGRVSNFSLFDVDVQGMNNAITIGATAILTGLYAQNCQFSYNRGPHVAIASPTGSGATDLINYQNVRFEQTNNNASLYTTGGVTGPHIFSSCVFEGCSGNYAVAFAANMTECKFIGTHFESNGSAPSGATGDVSILSNSCVSFDGCNFASPVSGIATSFYNITVGFQANARITVTGCRFSGAGVTNYLGAISYNSQAGLGPTFTGNYYVASGTFKYFPQNSNSGAPNVRRVNDWATAIQGTDSGNIVAYLQTTDGSAHVIYGGSVQYALAANSGNYAVVDIVGISNDATTPSYYATTLETLFYVDGSYLITLIPASGASFNASTATSTLTLTSTAVGNFALGQTLSGASIPTGTIIVGLLTGTLGASGSTYSLSTSPGTIVAEAMTSASPVIRDALETVAWSVATNSTAANVLNLSVTGTAGKTINWTASIRWVKASFN